MATNSENDNHALIYEFTNRRKEGEDFEEIASGPAKGAISQLNETEVSQLRDLTDPEK